MLNEVTRRLRALFRRDELDRDLDDEIRFHLEKEIEQNITRGMSPREARTEALKSFGGVERFKEEARDVRGVRLIDDTWQDVRYGLRMMRKTPGFTIAAVLSLALGIGANTALFSVVDSVFLKTLPVKDPNDLVLFEWQSGRPFRTTGINGYGVPRWPPGKKGNSAFHPRFFETLRAQDSAVTDWMAFVNLWDANIVADGSAEKADGQYVSGGYFSGLGVQAFLGRTIEEADDVAGAPPVAVITYRYWQDRFGGDPTVLGKRIDVNKVAFTIVGVTPPGFFGTLQVDTKPVVTIPLSTEPLVAGTDSSMDKPGEPGPWFLHLMARLEPGATLDMARDSLDGTFRSLALEMMPPPKRANEPAQLDPNDYPQLLARSGSRGMLETRHNYSSTIYFLFGVVGLVLLIACANVANMLLARSAARGPEITVRLAIGAGRMRLLRQLLTESLLLSLAGGVLGVIFALWGAKLLMAMGTTPTMFLPSGVDYDLNWRALGFTLGISVLTGILFGLAPAWRATRLDLTSGLKEGSRNTVGLSRSRLSKGLVVAQLAMSLVLLVGAGLLVRTVRNLGQVDVGFNQDGLLTFLLRPSALGYKNEKLMELYGQLLARLDALPGVQSATFMHVPLIAHNMNGGRVILPGETVESDAQHDSNRQIIRENYFETMQIPLLSGRRFTESDDAAAPRVAIVSETFARKFFPDEEAVGKRVGFNEETLGLIEIVGIARDTKYSSQREEIEPLLYTPWRQEGGGIGRMAFALRTSGDPTALAPSVREIVRELDKDLPVTSLETQVAKAQQSFAGESVLANLLIFFGLLALLLAAVGLYGVMAYSVAQRTNEIGIRMALGAHATNVLGMVIGQGMKVVMIGLVIGMASAFALKTFVESELYGVQATDPLTFSVVGASLLAVALLACWIPARRATRVDPVIALRSE
jgi:predicted permease